jgi:hypothetical protein
MDVGSSERCTTTPDARGATLDGEARLDTSGGLARATPAALDVSTCRPMSVVMREIVGVCRVTDGGTNELGAALAVAVRDTSPFTKADAVERAPADPLMS